MDFELDEEHQAVRDLADQILGDRSTPDHLREVEADDGFDRATWSELARAGLLGLSLDEVSGGAGLGILANALVAEAVGRHTAATPFRHTMAAMGALSARGGAFADVAAAAAAGETVLTVGLDRGPDATTVHHPTVLASPDRDATVLRGDVLAVPFGHVADQVVVAATTDQRRGALYLVEGGAAGIEWSPVSTTTGLPAANAHLDGAPATLIATDDGEALGRLVEHLRSLGCSTMAGVCDGALSLAAAYASEREQFGSKIGTFQAVAHRLADAYIDHQAIRLTALQAAWRLESGQPAMRQLASAMFWAAEGGQRIVHACQHVHGGIGVDTDYPLHRYFLAKELELELGGATPRALLELGGSLASDTALAV